MNVAVQLLFFAVVWTQLSGLSLAYEYCKNKEYLCSVEKKEHIICNLSTVAMGEGMELVGVVPMTTKLKNKFLELHDKCRNDIACGEVKDSAGKLFPKATRMRNLIWDYELAYIAQVHAERCHMSHDLCRNTDRFPISGQNLYESSSSVPGRSLMNEINQSVMNWFAEHNLVKDGVAAAKLFPREDLKQVGHFTVMVNDHVSRIGCGMTYCIGNKGATKKYDYHITCNYDFSNLGRIYADGDSKSKCDEWETTPSSEYSCLCHNNGKIFG